MGNRRSKEEVQKIDNFLKAYYENEGAIFCAKNLGLSLAYVRNRAYLNDLHDTTMEGTQHSKYAKEVFDLRLEKQQLQKDNDVLQGRNKDLRKEMIKLVAENRRLRKPIVGQE